MSPPPSAMTLLNNYQKNRSSQSTVIYIYIYIGLQDQKIYTMENLKCQPQCYILLMNSNRYLSSNHANNTESQRNFIYKTLRVKNIQISYIPTLRKLSNQQWIPVGVSKAGSNLRPRSSDRWSNSSSQEGIFIPCN